MSDKDPQPSETKTSLGLPVNTTAALCYASGFLPYAGWLTGLLLFLFEKNQVVKFHALQSTTLFGGIAVLQFILANTFVLSKLFSLLYIGQFILWLILIYKTYHGEKWVLPQIGEWVEKQLGKAHG
jgi:uncharacterized membrane protein